MPVVTAVSGRRLWLFRLSAVILCPLVVFGSIELALRLAGYGYPTSFFLRTHISGHDFFVPNDKFTFRFFSAALARPPLPIRMAADKSTNTYRVFLFGESAAAGADSFTAESKGNRPPCGNGGILDGGWAGEAR